MGHRPGRPPVPPSLCFIYLTLCVSHAQETLPGDQFSGRSPHGLSYQTPMVLSPAAFEFFHPDIPTHATGNVAASPGSAPPPTPALASAAAGEARANTVHEKVWPAVRGGGSSRATAEGMGAVILGVVLAVFLAMGVNFYILSKQRALSADEANAIKREAAVAEAMV